MNVFSSDSWLSRFFYLVFDIVILHIFWIICSIPIITIGASTTALHYCFMKRARRDEGYTWKNFFISFKENFKQSTIIWIILLIVGAILITDIRIGFAATTSLGRIMVFASSLLLIPYTLICLYIFPIQAKFENPIRLTFKNALLMPIANLGYTLILVFIIATFVFFIMRYNMFVGLCIVSGMGIYGFLTSNIFVFVFRKYLPDELREDAEASGMDKIEF